MKNIIYFLLICLFLNGCEEVDPKLSPDKTYPEAIERTVSKENTKYFVDPVNGSDKNTGISKKSPWKTFRKINQLFLTKGNRIEILSPGTFKESLFLIGKGSVDSPITIQFSPGEYNFYPEKFFKSKFNISNTNDAPDSLKSVAFYFLEAENIKLKGNGAEIVSRGKTMLTGLSNCKNISIENISFDYKRPTVSEMTVTSINDRYADVKIHKDSKYRIADSSLIWVGEGWEHKAQRLWQIFNYQNQRVERKNLPIQALRFSNLGQNLVRIHFNANPGLTKGLTYQNRDIFRDYASTFIQQSKNISLANINIHFMHGMGIVSQYSENITIDSLHVKPEKKSGRTCSAWADILHFSGCKGQIEIKNSYLSAANDDAVNVHGTHLRIVEMLSKRKIKVRFMHPQTFGFDAFFEKDSIEFIRSKTLLPYSKNLVVNAKRLNKKEIELTLDQDIPNNIRTDDAIENISWTPNVTIQNNTITNMSTRGILVTTRGKVTIKNNRFRKTQMSAILIADDANSWFESGYVTNVTISNNKFIECKAPVINIHPENSVIVDGQPVHKNVQITDNQFIISKNDIVLSAKSTENIKFTNNTINSEADMALKDLINIKACYNIEIRDNQLTKTDGALHE